MRSFSIVLTLFFIFLSLSLVSASDKFGIGNTNGFGFDSKPVNSGNQTIINNYLNGSGNSSMDYTNIVMANKSNNLQNHSLTSVGNITFSFPTGTPGSLFYDDGQGNVVEDSNIYWDYNIEHLHVPVITGNQADLQILGATGYDVILSGGGSGHRRVVFSDPISHFVSYFDTSNLSSNRIQTLPDKAGMFAMTSDINSSFKQSLTDSLYCYANGTNITGANCQIVSGGNSGNPFNQVLNTTSNGTLYNLSATYVTANYTNTGTLTVTNTTLVSNLNAQYWNSLGFPSVHNDLSCLRWHNALGIFFDDNCTTAQDKGLIFPYYDNNSGNVLVSIGTGLGWLNLSKSYSNNTQIYNRTQIDSMAGAWNDTHNATYDTVVSQINNATYNASIKVPNQNCPTGKVVNGTFANGTLQCTTDQTGGGGVSNYNNIAMTNISDNFNGHDLTNVGSVAANNNMTIGGSFVASESWVTSQSYLSTLTNQYNFVNSWSSGGCTYVDFGGQTYSDYCAYNLNTQNGYGP